MAVSKVILNGNTLMDVTQDTVAADKLLQTYTATKNDGTKVTGTYVPQTCVLQSKTVSPSTSQQTVSPDSGYDGLSSVTVNAMPSGTATTPETTITANPTISVSASGLITASVSKTQDVTPSVSAGYVASGTSGTITVNGSNTQQLTVYNGAHHAVSSGYTVTVSLTNPINSSNFSFCDISEQYSSADRDAGHTLGTIQSPTGSASVSVPLSLYGIIVTPFGEYGSGFADRDVTVTGGVSYIGRDSTIGGGKFSVTGDGTITIDNVDYYDDD